MMSRLKAILVSVDGSTLEARISIAREGVPAEFQPGASFPYFFGYYETRVVDMILDSSIEWVRVMYEPTDSIRIAANDGSLS